MAISARAPTTDGTRSVTVQGYWRGMTAVPYSDRSHGAIAQLVERIHGMEEARGSILLSSTPMVPGQTGRRAPRDDQPVNVGSAGTGAAAAQTAVNWRVVTGYSMMNWSDAGVIVHPSSGTRGPLGE